MSFLKTATKLIGGLFFVCLASCHGKSSGGNKGQGPAPTSITEEKQSGLSGEKTGDESSSNAECLKKHHNAGELNADLGFFAVLKNMLTGEDADKAKKTVEAVNSNSIVCPE